MKRYESNDQNLDIEALIKGLALSVADYGGSEYREEAIAEAEEKLRHYPKSVIKRIDNLLQHFSPAQRDRLVFDLCGRNTNSKEFADSYLTLLEGVTDLSGLQSMFESAEVLPIFQGLKLMSKDMSDEEKDNRMAPLRLSSPESLRQQTALFRFTLQLYGSTHYPQVCYPQYTDTFSGIVIANPYIYEAIVNSPDDADLMAQIIRRHGIYDTEAIVQLVAVMRDGDLHDSLNEGAL